MKMSRSVALGAVMIAVLSQTAGACDNEEGTATDSAVCVDPATEIRVDDDKCDDDDGHGFVWFYYAPSYHAPAVGSSLKSTPFYKTPTGQYISRVPSTGGFGGHMGTTGG